MPGAKPGQVYSYPQKHWKKKRYQYLRYFLAPKHVEREAGEISSLGHNENSGGLGGSGIPIGGLNEVFQFGAEIFVLICGFPLTHWSEIQS